MTSVTREAWRLASLSVLYVVAGVLGRLTIIDGHSLSLAWPAAGVGAVWLATSSRRRLPLDLLLLGSVVFVVNLATGAPAALAGLFVVTNLLQAGAFVLLVRRLRPHLDRFGGADRIGSLRDLAALTTAAVLSCVVSASVGVTGLTVLGAGVDSWKAFLIWVGRNVTGVLVVGLLLLLLLERLRGAAPEDGLGARLRRVFWTSTRHAVEAVVIGLVSVGLLWAVFGAVEALPIGFLLLFSTVLAGVRLGPLGVVVHGLLLGTGAVAWTLADRGPFAGIPSLADRALVAQVFVSMIVVTGLVLALSRSERDRAIARLSELQATTAERAQLFGAVLEHMREGIAVVDADGSYVLHNPAGRRILAGAEELPPGVADSGVVLRMSTPDGTVVTAAEMPFARALAGEEVLGDYLVTPVGATEPIVLEVTAAQLPDSGGGTGPRAIVSYRDVTALRHDRDALATFAGVVAHDLKRPLSVITGWSESLADRFAEGPVGPEEGERTLARVTGAPSRWPGSSTTCCTTPSSGTPPCTRSTSTSPRPRTTPRGSSASVSRVPRSTSRPGCTPPPTRCWCGRCWTT